MTYPAIPYEVLLNKIETIFYLKITNVSQEESEEGK